MTKRTYRCKECGQQVVLYVNPTTAPTHLCPRHVNKSRPLEEVSDKE